MNNYKKLILAILLTVTMSGCGIDKVVKNVDDQLTNQLQKQNPYVIAVQSGYLNDIPDRIIGDTFHQFFKNPTWTHFESEDKEHVVEFSGYMMYMDTEVKAKLQFLVNEDGTFEIGALGFNDVPQDKLTTAALINAIFEDDGNLAEIPNSQEDLDIIDDSVTTDESVDVQLVFKAEDVLVSLSDTQIDYFKTNYPSCFEAHLLDYETESCLYFTTNPEERKKLEEFEMGSNDSAGYSD